MASGTLIRTLSGHTDVIESVAFSPNGRMLASGSNDKTIKFWDPASGTRIGSTTGYTCGMLDLLVASSAKEGYSPDCSLTPEEVGSGRPHAFMMYECAVRLQIYPMAAVAKIGDTPADIQEGLNAGAWSIGVAGTGNMIGLSLDDFCDLPEVEKESRLVRARTELEEAGAHYVVDSLADLIPVLDDIEMRLECAGVPAGARK